MKRILIVLIDLMIIYASILLSYKVLGSTLQAYWYNLWAFYAIYPSVSVITIVLIYALDIYKFSYKSISDLLYSVFLLSFLLMIGIMATCFFVRGLAFFFPRSILLTSAILYWLGLTVWYCILWTYSQKRIRRKHIIVIGPHANQLALKIKENAHSSYIIQHTCQENDEKLDEKLAATDIVYMTAGVTGATRDKILRYTIQNNIRTFFIPAYRDLITMTATIDKTDDIPTFLVDKHGLSVEEAFIKRMVDLLLATIGFIVLLPISAVIALLIKTDGGPMFYKQDRLTKDGKIFKIFKFRSMVPNAEKLSGPVLAEKDDPRITKIGHFIRATRIDEIPQLINIFKGDMSIVGPRPERPYFTETFALKTPFYLQRLKVKAGLTGLAQVEGRYNTSFEDKLRYDLMYISRYSLFRDLLIIMRTVKILFEKESTEGVVISEKRV